jgi:excinuclease ABC subunit B
MSLFQLEAPYCPTGDQPAAIAALMESLNKGQRFQTLWGVTGSGKTFTMANLIAQLGRPTLVISHNKTLAAQLYSEFAQFFPRNAVEYFISYYDYYQPEAYIPQTDTYIEKDASINKNIERLRLSTASSLVSRQDVVVVASVSCIYGLGSPEDFAAMQMAFAVGQDWPREQLLQGLVAGLYRRCDEGPFTQGRFRLMATDIDIYPAYLEVVVRLSFWGDTLEAITQIDPLSGRRLGQLDRFVLFPANPYITTEGKLELALGRIRKELAEQVAFFEQQNRLIEAQRIRVRTEHDMEMLRETGFCAGIENYSVHIDGRQPGQRPYCLLDFFLRQGQQALILIDESHVTLPQLRAMYLGDRARKQRLIDFGFRLPSALDNRPLRFEEFLDLAGQVVFVSATPGPFECQQSAVVAEQVIRPTGLLDPVISVRPLRAQVQDMLAEIHAAIADSQRVLVTTLTKRMAEDIAHYLRQAGIRVEYLHSDIDALERIEILRKLRRGVCDVLVGINLLREGLDLPEVALVGILDADKEGFLRSHTSLIQTAGRAARHEKGRVILYADVMTPSIRSCLALTQERREKQMQYNAQHGITPRAVRRQEQASLRALTERAADPVNLDEAQGDADTAEVLAALEAEMLQAAQQLAFERAAKLRDQIYALKAKLEAKPNP